MRCPSCQHENRAGRRFCTQCGATLALRCTACGAAIEPDDQFCGDCGRVVERDGSAETGGASGLRQITVVFADLVGSTSYATRLGPEEWRELARRFLERCATQIEHFGGHVAQYLGDGLLAYFGHPVAHEDDAGRAVHAGLGLIDAVAEMNESLEAEGMPLLSVRIGIHTGSVVTEAVDGRAPSAMGSTLHLASRFERIAGPDSVVISDSTRALLGGRFELTDLGPQQMKGLEDPVGAYRVLGIATSADRLAATADDASMGLVGREEEFAVLLDRWERAKSGSGQVVAIAGEAGIGKSRLLLALLEHLDSDSHPWAACYCAPFERSSSLAPVMQLVREQIGWEPGDPPQTRAANLDEALAGAELGDDETVALLADWLGLEPPRDLTVPELDPEVRRQRMLRALSAWLETVARRAPLVVAIEDLHWADPSTLDLLELLFEWAPDTSVLLVVTYRPEFQPRWGLPVYLTPIALPRLTREQSAALIREIVARSPREAQLDPTLVAKLVERTDGVPLFVEELAKMVAQGDRGHPEEGSAAGESAAIADLGDRDWLVPSTLQDLLEARLANLGPTLEIAQLGSVIGSRFSYVLLKRVSELNDDLLNAHLEVLVASGLVQGQGNPPAASYSFKHALVQDAAYEGILKRHRRSLHERVAREIEESSPQTAAERPELLARHYSLAGRHEEAAALWERAAQRATRSYANEEAIEHTRAALEMLRELPESPERDRREVRLQIGLAGTTVESRGFGNLHVEAPLLRARELCASIGEGSPLLPTLAFLCGHYMQRGKHRKTRDIGQELVRLTSSGSRRAPRVTAHFMLGAAHLWCGEYEAALENAGKGLESYHPEDYEGLGPGATEPGVVSHGIRGIALWCLGYADQGLREARRGIEIGRTRDPAPHVHSLGWALVFETELLLNARSPLEALRDSDEIVELATEHDFRRLLAWGVSMRACARIQNGELEAGSLALERALSEYDDAEAGFWRAWCSGILAEACGGLGQTEKALDLLHRAQAHAAERGEQFYEGDLYRIEGDLLLEALPDAHDGAEDALGRAVEIARKTGGRIWELRALASTARLRERQGLREEGLADLRSAYAWFREGFDTPDLVAARRLLDESGG